MAFLVYPASHRTALKRPFRWRVLPAGPPRRMMRRMVLVRAAVRVVLALSSASALFAQWPAYPTGGVPKTPDGKPDLAGPAPRTLDGKPDLSGIWQFVRQPAPTGTSAVAAARAANDITPLSVRLSQFWNLGAAFKDGLPFTPWGAEVHRQRVANNSKDNPDAHCLPLGIMQLHTHSQPRKMIQWSQCTPDRHFPSSSARYWSLGAAAVTMYGPPAA